MSTRDPVHLVRGGAALVAAALAVAACSGGDTAIDAAPASVAAATQLAPAAVSAPVDAPAPTTTGATASMSAAPPTSTIAPTVPSTFEPPPPEFEAFVDHVPPEVVARATWREGCPVALEDLRYIRMSHWGFDGAVHTGEMIVHADVASDIVVVFARLLEVGFPIEEMRVESPADVERPAPDYNNTTAFTCRPVTGGSGWSQHAYGLAIDLNPLLNPYLRGDVLLPELAGDYLDRDDVRPGMIVEGDAVVQAFDDIGWGWGGRWRSLKDWQHFSADGR